MAKNYVKLAVLIIAIDPSYQRDLDESRVKAMADNLDESRIGVPVLSLRKDGSYVVLDGQHRIEAIRRSDRPDTKILCEVHNGLSVADEAALFLKLNNGRKAVRVFPKYRARMVAKEPVAVEFTRIVHSLGLRIGPVASKNTIAAIVKIESAHRRNANLDRTLYVLKKWGAGEASVFDGELIADMSNFLFDYADDVDVDEFALKLAKHDPGIVMRTIKGFYDQHGNRRSAANGVFLDKYNHRRAKKIAAKPTGAR